MRKKPRRRLTWQRTDLPTKPRNDYTGFDLDRPHFYARVYLDKGSGTDRCWHWLLAEAELIATGGEATLNDAVDAAERAFAKWRRLHAKRSA